MQSFAVLISSLQSPEKEWLMENLATCFFFLIYPTEMRFVAIFVSTLHFEAVLTRTHCT